MVNIRIPNDFIKSMRYDYGLLDGHYHLNDDKTMVRGKMRDKRVDHREHRVFDTEEVWISTSMSGPLELMWDFIVCPTRSVENYNLKFCLYK